MDKEKLVRWAQGAGAGVVLALAGGLWTGLIVTQSTANAQADKVASSLLVRICAEDMLASPASLAVLKSKEPRDYDDAVRDAWKPVLPAGITVPSGWDFRRSCGTAIEAMLNAPAKS